MTVSISRNLYAFRTCVHGLTNGGQHSAQLDRLDFEIRTGRGVPDGGANQLLDLGVQEEDDEVAGPVAVLVAKLALERCAYILGQ
jgi:hypothetical protein